MQKSWFVALGLIALSGPALANDAIGTWLVEDKTAVIKVDACEQGLCGAIGWAKTPGTDKNNPDPKLQDRDIVGMRFFSMKPAGQNKWEGEIYNAKDGKTYKGNVSLAGPNALKIGEQLTVTFMPARNGAPLGALRTVKRADGKIIEPPLN